MYEEVLEKGEEQPSEEEGYNWNVNSGHSFQEVYENTHGDDAGQG